MVASIVAAMEAEAPLEPSEMALSAHARGEATAVVEGEVDTAAAARVAMVAAARAAMVASRAATVASRVVGTEVSRAATGDGVAAPGPVSALALSIRLQGGDTEGRLTKIVGSSNLQV